MFGMVRSPRRAMGMYRGPFLMPELIESVFDGRLKEILPSDDFSDDSHDVYEENGYIVARMLVPGIEPSELDIEVHPAFVSVKWSCETVDRPEKEDVKENVEVFDVKASDNSDVKAENNLVKVSSNDGAKAGQIAMERYRKSICSFERKIAFPKKVDSTKAVAKCALGVLTVTAPVFDRTEGVKVKVAG